MVRLPDQCSADRLLTFPFLIFLSVSLMASIRPLRVEELAEILAIQFDEEALPIFNTIGLQYTQKKRLCPYVRVSSPSLTGEAIKSYSSLTSPSRST
jgi:hypothetical protein